MSDRPTLHVKTVYHLEGEEEEVHNNTIKFGHASHT